MLLALACGCGDPLDLAQIIERTRPLGVRVRVEGDEARAWPRAGETATAEWLVASPEDPALLRWELIVCRTEDTRRGPTLCVGEPIARASGGPSSSAPAVSFVVPPAREVGEIGMLALHGVFCEEGVPRLERDASEGRCDDGRGEPIRVSADLFVQMDGDTNENPDLTNDVFSLDGEELPPTSELPDPTGDCRGGPLVQVSAAESKHVVRVAIGGDDREEFTTPTPLGVTREALTLSHFSTAGELDRQFTVIEAGDDAAVSELEIEFRSPDPEEVPAGGLPARLIFVARDGRGGTDWTERHLCFVP